MKIAIATAHIIKVLLLLNFRSIGGRSFTASFPCCCFFCQKRSGCISSCLNINSRVCLSVCVVYARSLPTGVSRESLTVPVSCSYTFQDCCSKDERRLGTAGGVRTGDRGTLVKTGVPNSNGSGAGVLASTRIQPKL